MWVDLTQPYFEGMPCSAPHGVPSFGVEHGERADDGWQISITKLAMGAHTGTHVDAARHFYPDGPTIDEYPLESFVGPGAVLDLTRDGPGAVSAEDLERAAPGIARGDVVFIHFGFAERFRDASYAAHPHLSVDAAELLVERQVRLFGTDTLTPDAPALARGDDFDYPVHRLLLGNGIPIVENLGAGLRTIAGRSLTLGALPLRIDGGDGAPVAAFGLLP
jgi:arylformamidase